jgi:hypothetical protein
LTERVDAAPGGSADEYRLVRISGEELFETHQANGKSFKQTNGKQSASSEDTGGALKNALPAGTKLSASGGASAILTESEGRRV